MDPEGTGVGRGSERGFLAVFERRILANEGRDGAELWAGNGMLHSIDDKRANIAVVSNLENSNY